MPSAMAAYPSIRVDGSCFKTKDKIHWYEGATLGVLQTIAASDSGQIVLAYVQSIKAGRLLTIKPYDWAYIVQSFDPKERVGQLFNATTEPTDYKTALDAGQSVWREALTGPTRGSDTDIYFTKWVIDNKKYRKLAGVPKGAAGSQPDEILLHEIVHAAANMLGRNDRTKTGDAMIRVSEFRSVLVANIYATDPTNKTKGRPVRKDYSGVVAMTSTTGDLNHDFLAIAGYRDQVRTFISRFPGLALPLALVKSTFNPIRTLLADFAAGK
jgi:hypothetical protein